jgi:hypothetical protein
MKQIVETKQCNSYLLQKVQVGLSSYFDYSIQNSRLSYINSFDNINVIPPLHRNSFPIMGLSKKYKIIETRLMGNNFTILNNKNTLITWNILSGKTTEKYKIPGADYADYSVYYDNDSEEISEHVYLTGGYNKTLIIKKDPEVG